ncbi:MAG: 4-alpha-glucanotransferase [Candidatus Saccharimonadaceae bacterium]
MTTIKFNIDYQTQWGEELCISGSIPQLGCNNQAEALILSTSTGITWFGEIKIEAIDKQPMEYFYFVRKNGYEIRKEQIPPRLLMVKENVEVNVKDHWKEKLFHSYLFTSVYTECIFNHIHNPLNAPEYDESLILNVICPYARKNEQVVISGEGDLLGNWNLKKALPLASIREGEWQIELNAAKLCSDVSYKFVLVNNSNLSQSHWEECDNRILRAHLTSEGNIHQRVEMAMPYNYPSFYWKGKGVSIPLFSLKSENSSGIGEFLDLKIMVDWAVKTDQNMIQILPINDTNSTATWKDSYPYNSISIFALNPIYISLSRYTLRDKAKLIEFQNKSKVLNALVNIDYEKVYTLKYAFFNELFVEQGNVVIQSEEYINFYNKNKDWLFPYVWFCYLRDRYRTSNFKEWDVYSIYRPDLLDRLIETDGQSKKETDFYAYVQFLAHQQMSEAKQYAHEKGVALKGDIPIGINSDSVDAWTDPNLFNMEMQAGAPPDDFSIEGQNWGFPTYNWKEMERDNFVWWKKRFRKMSDYFDAYRIDHILGFFRIWEMPREHVQGLLGHFNPALPFLKEELYLWNFPFDEQRMSQPYIHESMLYDFFGEFADEATSKYLDVISWQRFQLKPFCNTQQKINHLFEGKSDAKEQAFRNGLFGLCAEVLFVPDPYSQNSFHPRITGQYTYSYAHLDDYVKEVYNRIYNDFFYKRHNYFWYEQAMRKLPELISATSMLVCGEDLGMVPDCVNWVMNELQILSLEIQRMPKQTNILFADLNQYPYLSVNTTSTHDMSTIRGWWEENRENIQFFYNHMLGRQGEAPQECTTEICEQILEQHLSSNSMWSIFPWQDWMSIDGALRRSNPHEERINVPSNSQHYWRYRMHITLEQLLNENEFNERVRKMSR